MTLEELLYSQGFGTRRVCAGLVQQGLVQVNGQLVIDAQQVLEVHDGLPFVVQGQAWQYQTRACIMLHKPAGTECSHKPSIWPSVYSLLPAPLRQRPSKSAVAGVQAVGRLDQDTTGLLLLTDDGTLLHRMTSPKRHVPKVYQVQCKHPVTADQTERLLAGVVLHDSPQPVQAQACEPTGSHSLALTLTQGKYHQVKRMLAA
ncbi:MAG: RNA pseudouridine synthase, partial [Brachymonas sp.]|nr:RNA pseudouridine synthase [Brachymonas sp.]